ncbi:F-box protein At5g07610-like [Bidens hawaiensis]|uniref:F-box protein At5g07610-like n=1 Tax=Bidens hawaiensis TaxID=980011 RepID=UPI00404A5A02
MEDSDLQSEAVIVSNDDLLTEILVWLPVTSILRFKSVSKHWRLLLTHKHFTHRYDNNNLFKSPGLFARTLCTFSSKSFAHLLAGDIYVSFDVENRSPPPFRCLDLYFNRSRVKILHSCNGLLLCHTLHNGAREHFIFNPTTKQLAIIPPAPKYICSMALAFHLTHCMHYKVVCIRCFELLGDVFQIQVYSSDTRKWKICVESFSAQNLTFCQPVYWNGAVHWAPDCGSCNFLYFKLDVEELQMLPVPEGLVSGEMLMYFGESRGHLHLILHNNREADSFCVNVYEMLGDHSVWFVKYRLQLDALLDDVPNMIYPSQCALQVVDVVRNKEEEDTFLVLLGPLKMIRYNVHDKSFQELYRYKEFSYEFTSAHRYIQILSSF